MTRSPTTSRARGCWRRTPTTSWSTSVRRTRRGCAGCRSSTSSPRCSRRCAGRRGRRPRCSVKIAPDLSDDEVRKIAELVVALEARRHHRHQHDPVARGAAHRRRPSSRPPAPAGSRARRSRREPLEVLRLLRAVVPPELCVISVGGVETGADVAARLAAGATLVQGYTAFLYRGPFWARAINKDLLEGSRVRVLPALDLRLRQAHRAQLDRAHERVPAHAALDLVLAVLRAQLRDDALTHPDAVGDHDQEHEPDRDQRDARELRRQEVA